MGTRNVAAHLERTQDGQDGGNNYWRGTAVYLKRFAKPLNTLTDVELRNAATFACWAASLSTERAGGISSVPPLDVVLSHMKG